MSTCAEKTALDIGASTGGFTDCMLQRGAEKIYAVDVGYGQLDWKLRNDPRVIVLEKTNARFLTRDQVQELVDICAIDVSFISLTLILPNAFDLLKPDGVILALIKPQFELQRSEVGKGGIVRDPPLHQKAQDKIVAFCERSGARCRRDRAGRHQRCGWQSRNSLHAYENDRFNSAYRKARHCGVDQFDCRGIRAIFDFASVRKGNGACCWKTTGLSDSGARSL